MAASTQAGAFALQAGERPISIRKFSACVVFAGLLNATIVAFLICHLPASQEPSIRSLVIRAFLYVVFAVGAGAAGARFYWNRFSIPFKTDPPLSFSLYARVNASAWVWMPAIVLLSRQDSPASSALSGVSAALLACGLRQVIPDAAHTVHHGLPDADVEGRQMFAATLRAAPREAHGYVIALSLYATGCLLLNRFYLFADPPLAIGAFLFAWNLTPEPPLTVNEARARAISRLAMAAPFAILVTLFVLLSGIGHRNRIEASNLAHRNVRGDDTGQNRRHSAGPYIAGISGYESVILWPIPNKKQIVAPVPASISPFAERAAKPLIFRFDGPYWYFQPPAMRPGPMAHEAHGNPFGINIEANNFLALKMQAVQNLGSPVRLARCRELQVTIENRDNLRGPIALGIVLTDSRAPGKPSLSLGEQVVLSSEPGQFAVKVLPVDETLRFVVPNHAAIRKFDQITVLYLPGVEHWQTGARIAVEQFELIPR